MMLNLIGVIVAFILIIFLIRKKINFGFSLIIGSLVVGVFSLQEITLVDISKAFIEAIIYSFEKPGVKTDTIELAVLLTLIYILARCMQETGAIKKLIDSLRSVFYKGGTLGIIPAVYGLMPVPGGALFSAPLIDKEGEGYHLSQSQKNFLNVWFRHIWFPIFPISSAMMTICSDKFSNIDIYKLVIADFPVFLLFIIIGMIYLKVFIRKNQVVKKPSKRDYSGLVYILPPIIPIFIYLILFLLGFQNLKEYQIKIFILGVVISIFLLYRLTSITWNKYIKILKNSLSFNLAIVIFGIMIFREMITVSKANIILADLIAELPFPSIIILILIPLILGLLTGYNLGAIALSYPLVEPFFQNTGLNIVGLTSIIFMGSLVGYLISPIHLCNVVSSDYLKTDVTRIYKMYIPAVAVVLLFQTFFITIFFSS